MSQIALRLGMTGPGSRLTRYTSPLPNHKPLPLPAPMPRVAARKRSAPAATRCVLLAAIAGMMVFAPAPSQAQTRIESFFNNAAGFLERQGRAIERQLNQHPGAPPAAARKPAAPPLPAPNPGRAARSETAAPTQAEEGKTESGTEDRIGRRSTPPARLPQPASPPSPPPAPDAGELASIGHDAVPFPARNPAHDKTGEKPEKPERPPHPGEIASADWTEAEIIGGRSACAKMLSRIVATYETLDPIRKGSCGAPAPIRLSAINATPRVEIRPPALVTCAMAVQLAAWMDGSVQPAAKKYLGEEIVAVRNVASYSCRNRYNAPGKRISEHALANALDIAAFETASGKTVTLSRHWHAREPKPVGEARLQQAGARTGDTAIEVVKNEDETIAASPASARRLISAADAVGQENPPPPEQKPKAAETVRAPEADFLRAAFTGACAAFGTVLGPEANAAHHDHFHLDMKERSHGGYCE